MTNKLKGIEGKVIYYMINPWFAFRPTFTPEQSRLEVGILVGAEVGFHNLDFGALIHVLEAKRRKIFETRAGVI